MQTPIDIRQEIPSNKFYPPRLDTSGGLFRSRLIVENLGADSPAKKIIVIEAQAGQGKSVLAAQFLNHFDLRSAWYQVGPEDTDPVLLLSALMANFSRKLPGFESRRLNRIIRQGEIGPLDLKRCINILLADLDRFLADDFYLVFDDMHLIEDAGLTTALLDHLLDTAPSQVHFLLISLLYSLYIKSGNPLKAKETILNYRKVMQDMDYDQDQIDELLFQVAAKAV